MVDAVFTTESILPDTVPFSSIVLPSCNLPSALITLPSVLTIDFVAIDKSFWAIITGTSLVVALPVCITESVVIFAVST